MRSTHIGDLRGFSSNASRKLNQDFPYHRWIRFRSMIQCPQPSEVSSPIRIESHNRSVTHTKNKTRKFPRENQALNVWPVNWIVDRQGFYHHLNHHPRISDLFKQPVADCGSQTAVSLFWKQDCEQFSQKLIAGFHWNPQSPITRLSNRQITQNGRFANLTWQ
jgi:hypothetical protein